MATTVQPASASHSLRERMSSVMVPKVRGSFTGLPPGPGMVRQPTITFLSTSRPQQRSYTTSMLPSFRPARRVPSVNQNLIFVLPKRGQQSMVLQGTGVQLLLGLAAPVRADLLLPDRAVDRIAQDQNPFHPRWRPEGAWATDLKSELGGGRLPP